MADDAEETPKEQLEGEEPTATDEKNEPEAEEAPPQASEAPQVGDSKGVKNSTNCQAPCNRDNLNKSRPPEPKTFEHKNTEGPPGPDIHGINPMQENLSLVLHAVKDLRLEVRPVPEPKPNQVLMQMEVVGICGSDVHYYINGKIGHFVLKDPMVMGHEASGTVIKCGEHVTSLKPGDRVAIEPHMPCRECEYCKIGRYNLCVNLFFCATPPDDGNLSRYYVHDADFCYKLPENMDFEDGTLMEPLAVGVHACTKLKVTCGDHVLIMGVGPIGLVALLAAKAMGASKILVTDIEDPKINKALEMGANHAINIGGMSEDDVVKKIHEILGQSPNKSVDCCGSEFAIRAAIKATKSGGKFVAVGMGKDDILIPYTDALIREVDILGSFRYVNNYPTAIDMVASGKINPKPLVTHHFKLENAIDAFEMAANQKEPFIKIMLHTNPFWDPTGFLNKHPSQMATPHKEPSSAQPPKIDEAPTNEALVAEPPPAEPTAEEAPAEEAQPEEAPAEEAPLAEEPPAEEAAAEEG